MNGVMHYQRLGAFRVKSRTNFELITKFNDGLYVEHYVTVLLMYGLHPNAVLWQNSDVV